MTSEYLEAIVERYCAIIPALRSAWEDERSRRDDCNVYTLFFLLTDEFRRLLRRCETNVFPLLFAEIEESILDPEAKIVEGFPSGVMPPDYKTKIDPKEIEQLVEFLVSSTSKKGGGSK